jgi:mono/diheme cytochrome c family protein
MLRPPHVSPPFATIATVWITLGLLLLISVAPVAFAQPVIPGLVSSELDPKLMGLVLVEELNCAACHESEAPFAGRSKKAPRLSVVGSRVNPSYLEAFIRDPHGIKPGTTMPDALTQLAEREREQVAQSLTHFLLSLKDNDFSLQPPDAVAAGHGERLFHSRGCVACHAPRDADGAELLRKSSAPLGALDKKYSFKSLVEFLRRPHASRPSGRMPDMSLQGQDVERIAHYLLRETRVPGHLAYTLYRGQVWEGLDSDTVTAERAGQVADFALESLGKVQHQTAIEYEGWLNIPKAGSYRFFLHMNGGSLQIDGKQILLEEPSNRRGPKQLQGTAELQVGWRNIQLTYFHTGREPKFAFEMKGPQFQRQSIPSSMLSVSDKPIATFEPLEVDAELAARGRQQFGALGCANCHDDLRIPSDPGPAFAKLDPSKGCLSEGVGAWPHFYLSAEQRNLITKALPGAEKVRLNDRQQIDKTLVTFNCIACHERAGLGGIAQERNAHFTGTRPGLGNQGRLPPPLSHVGAKLTPAWIAEVLLRGNRQRDYLDANMPQYGDANVGHLVELFGKVDKLEAVTFPEIANIQESKNAGYEMMGTTGLSCIACHDFNGQEAAGAGALDIVHVTERIQKNWFHLYMRNPARFHDTVIMPSYWPGGDSVRQNILTGDSAQQIEALWAYLADGTRAKKPEGLSRQSNEIRVTDVAEIARGRGTAGYRGIGVGYPERINLAFDSEEMALRQLWKGEFASVNHGSFNARGGERISFSPGIPFHRLKSMDDNWPYKGKTNYTFPHDHGYQFRGYHLDALRRPTFQYRYGEIKVEDFFEDVLDKDGVAKFKRTFRFDSPSAQSLFYFRAATGKKITTQSDRTFVIDQLQLRITCNYKGFVREGEPGEVLIPLSLPKGRSTLTLEYQW